MPSQRASPARRDASTRLESRLVAVRWFGVALGAYVISSSYRTGSDAIIAPDYLRPVGYALIAGLAALNLLVAWGLRRRVRPDRLALLTLIGDAIAVTAIVWLYSFDPVMTTWVTLYVVALEAAVKYALRGALLITAAAFASEILRVLYRHVSFGTEVHVESVVFRIGIMGVVAWVAGAMAKQLDEERQSAEQYARELEAFHRIVLAGAVGKTVDDTVSRIAVEMGAVLGYDAFAILLAEEHHGVSHLRCVAAYGYPEGTVGRRIAASDGIVGRSFTDGATQLVEDVTKDAGYVPVAPDVVENLAVPIPGDAGPAGVVLVESRAAGRLARERGRLEGLAPQLGIVIGNARRLATEHATVQRLLELDEMKRDFVAITSHELRTPLTAISGYIKTLRRAEIPRTWDMVDRALATLDRQSDKLIRLVEDLLLISRIEVGAMRLASERVDVQDLLAEMLREIGDDADRVIVEGAHGVPEIWTDPGRLEQVLRNLVDNALKFSAPPLPVAVAVAQEGDRVVIDVADRGPGISQEQLGIIFEEFRQGRAGGSSRRQYGGVGLGLAIARTLTEALGGTLDVASRIGVGTRFRISLPLRPAGYDAGSHAARSA